MVSPLLHHLSRQRQSKTVCGTLTHPDPEPRRRKINFDPSDIHKLKANASTSKEDPTPQAIQVPLPLMFLTWCPLQWLTHNKWNVDVSKSLSNVLCLRSYVDSSHLIASKSKRFSVTVHRPEIRGICYFQFFFVSSSPLIFISLGSWRQACV